MSTFHARVLRFESGAVCFYIAYVQNSSALGTTYKIRLQARSFDGRPIPPSAYLGRQWCHSRDKIYQAFPSASSRHESAWPIFDLEVGEESKPLFNKPAQKSQGVVNSTIIKDVIVWDSLMWLQKGSVMSQMVSQWWPRHHKLPRNKRLCGTNRSKTVHTTPKNGIAKDFHFILYCTRLHVP